MGSYGIGPARVMGAIVESNFDENGIIWPKEVAPFQIHLLYFGKELESKHKSEQTYNTLRTQGYEVLFDDRQNISPGAKLKDADLIGCPIQIIVSPKNQKEELLEIKVRSTMEKRYVKTDQVIKKIQELLSI